MVRFTFAEVSVDSVRDAFVQLQNSNKGRGVLRSKQPSAATKSSATVTTTSKLLVMSSSTIVPLPYPVGKSTLQVTGVHFLLKEIEKVDRGKNVHGGIVVLLYAHVLGMLDAEARVFTVAAVTLGDEHEEDVSAATKRRAVDDTRHAETTATELSSSLIEKQHRLPRTAFAKLDLRVQMEKVSFSVRILPAQGKGLSSSSSPSSSSSLSFFNNIDDGALTVTIFGVVSPLEL